MSKKYSLSEETKYNGHKLRVEFDIVPSCKPTWGWDGGDPGHDAFIEDYEVTLLRGKKQRVIEDPDGLIMKDVESELLERVGAYD